MAQVALDVKPLKQEKERLDPLVWKIGMVAMLGPLMTQLDSTVVNVSLEDLRAELHTTLTTIQWVTSGYLLALALTLPLTGWLVDRIGAKRVYMVCFTIFTLTSLFCGMATSAGSLIFFRVLQGAAGGLLTPMAQTMMARYAGRHMARVMGFTAMPVMIGPILGPALAGLILQHAGWPWIFYINLPVGILAMYAVWRVVPPDAETVNPRSFDMIGFLMLSPALVMLLHSLERIGTDVSNRGWSELELGASIVLLAAFYLHGSRLGKKALVDLGLFANRTFFACACTQFLSNAMIYGGQVLLPLYLLVAGGRSPESAGILLAATGLGMLCAIPWVGRLIERFGPRRVSSAGALVSALGTLPFALFQIQDFPIGVLLLVLFVRGAGIGCINIPSVSSAYTSIPRDAIPVATTALNIVQRLGGPVATTLLAISLHYSMGVHPNDMPQAFIATFYVLAGIHMLGFVFALRLPLRKPVSVRP
jgi:EmrB/QacA subfamily drug resistance transporter